MSPEFPRSRLSWALRACLETSSIEMSALKLRRDISRKYFRGLGGLSGDMFPGNILSRSVGAEAEARHLSRECFLESPRSKSCIFLGRDGLSGDIFFRNVGAEAEA